MFTEINQLFLISPHEKQSEKGKRAGVGHREQLGAGLDGLGEVVVLLCGTAPGKWSFSILPLWQSETSAVISDGGRDFVVVGHLLGRIFALERLKS